MVILNVMFADLCFLDPMVYRGPVCCVIFGHTLLHGFYIQRSEERWMDKEIHVAGQTDNQSTAAVGITLRLTFEFCSNDIGIAFDGNGQCRQLVLCPFRTNGKTISECLLKRIISCC